MENKWIPYILIFILAIAQYANTRNHDFAWDDAIVITENSRVQKGWSDIPDLFENIKSGKTEHRYGYRPISLFSFAADVEFFGVNSKASHRISIFYYGVLALLVLLFLQTIFPEQKWVNFLVAVLFVVHPLHTEVVANIKSRDEVLAMSFGLMAMLAYWEGLNKNKWFYYLLGLLFLILAFLSKENGLVFCGVAVLLAWYRLRDKTWKQWLKIGALIVGAFAVLIAIRTFVFSDLFYQNADSELTAKGVFIQDYFIGNPLFGLTDEPLLRYWNIIYLNGLYLFKFLIPYPLVHDYGYNYLKMVGFTDPTAWLALFALIGMLFFLIKGLRNRTVYGFGLAFYFITASIYLQIAKMGPDIFAERFMFIPLLGLALVLVDVLFRIGKGRKKMEAAIFSVLLLLSTGFFAMSWNRNEAWKNNQTLFETDLPRLHDGARVNYNYALLLHRIYYESTEAEQVAISENILKYYERVMSITDRLYPAYLDLGGAYMEFKQFDKAKVIFQQGIDEYPDISASYVQMAKYYMTFAQYAEAIPYLEKAIELGSEGSDYYYLLSICQFNTEQHQKAIKTLETGEKFGSVTGSYLALMVRLHLKLGQMDEAKEVLARGMAKFPGDAALLQMKTAIDTRSIQ